MRVKFLSSTGYQTYPETDDMIDIDEDILKEIGKTLQYSNGKILPFDGFEKLKREDYIKSRLSQLTQDFIQVDCGAIIPDIDLRRKEFASLHNELRVLQNKEPRVYADSTIIISE